MTICPTGSSRSSPSAKALNLSFRTHAEPSCIWIAVVGFLRESVVNVRRDEQPEGEVGVGRFRKAPVLSTLLIVSKTYNTSIQEDSRRHFDPSRLIVFGVCQCHGPPGPQWPWICLPIIRHHCSLTSLSFYLMIARRHQPKCIAERTLVEPSPLLWPAADTQNKCQG